MSDLAKGDVVQLLQDHVPLERGAKYAVLDDPHFSEALKVNVVDLGYIEHMPSPDWPLGAWSRYRCVRADWCRRNDGLSKAWKEARSEASV